MEEVETGLMATTAKSYRLVWLLLDRLILHAGEYDNGLVRGLESTIKVQRSPPLRVVIYRNTY